MKIALYYRHIDPADLAAFAELQAELAAHGVEGVRVADGDSVADADFLFSIGGDGTLLSCVQFVNGDARRGLPPIVGINFGHLGFLTTAGKEQVGQLVEELHAGHYTIERRSLLCLDAPAGTGCPRYALNEVCLHRSVEGSLMRTRVFVDDRYVAAYGGDGVIVATPTGSTAYSLACGGPILTPDSGCLVITPIAAHTMTLRPIIVPDTARITLLTDPSHPAIHLGADSTHTTLAGGTTLRLALAPFRISIVRTAGQDFFAAMRSKLMWGTEIRH